MLTLARDLEILVDVLAGLHQPAHGCDRVREHLLFGLAERDLDDALNVGVDWVALSFVQRAKDIAEARKLIRGRAAIMVEQMAYPVAQESKTALLLDLLERERFERVLVFTRTRRGAERLSHILSARDHSVNRIHADRTQSQREAALRGFRDGRTRVLVATDIAARGIDVDAVSHVINYDVPAAPEDYVHRVGRTGRAGNQGQAITIVAPVDELSMRAIERLTGQAVKRVVPEGFGGLRPAQVVAGSVRQM